MRWCDAVLPRVATRQWVIPLPWERRWLLARRPDLVQAAARGVEGAKCGAVAAQHIRQYIAGPDRNLTSQAHPPLPGTSKGSFGRSPSLRSLLANPLDDQSANTGAAL